ncbi:MAG TPA: O-succinylhomoserine sulfhydrylase [Alphaproteobacteria bacterium]|nr:O-succinylhomoserine sulfhydrylase [Alphaproteobacteria bacterium]
MDDTAFPNPTEDLSLDTALVRGGLRRSEFGETSEAIFLTSGFVYGSAAAAEARFDGTDPGFVYSRYANPTLDVLEKRLALIEGAEKCHATASGMAAVFTGLFCWLRAGDHVVASRALFGSCHVILTTILPRYGIEATLVDGADLDAWAAAMRPNTRAVFLETPANPTLDLVDVAAVAKIAHEAGAKVFVDNVFASPLGQRPLELGADVVMYSATKHIDGQGRCLGGAVLADAEFCNDHFMPYYRHTGPALSPFNAWVLLKGLETLSIRVERQAESALKLARCIEAHPAARAVRHPFLPSHPQHELAKRQMKSGGTLVAFDLGSKSAAFAFLDALRIVDISNNLGDTRSLATHPMTTTHRAMAESDRAAMGITDGLVRLSVGLEGIDDLTRDLSRALDAAARAR